MLPARDKKEKDLVKFNLVVCTLLRKRRDVYSIIHSVKGVSMSEFIIHNCLPLLVFHSHRL